jgi:hypothetical protein
MEGQRNADDAIYRSHDVQTAIANSSIDRCPLTTLPKQHARTARTKGHQDTFPRFVAFQRNQICESLCAGLPHRHLPLSGFLTLSTA